MGDASQPVIRGALAEGWRQVVCPDARPSSEVDKRVRQVGMDARAESERSHGLDCASASRTARLGHAAGTE
jgi:hypothetical protein